VAHNEENSKKVTRIYPIQGHQARVKIPKQLK